MNGPAAADPSWRLTLARAIAWALLLAGWVGLGGFALVLAPSVLAAFGLVALWLLALGLAATVATRDSLPAVARRAALGFSALLTAAALVWAPRGGGWPALLLGLVTWASMTALASGVVRSLRLARPARPGPPIAAAGLGALVAGLALGDPGDLHAMAWRLGALVLVAAATLAWLQPADGERRAASRCRAGLFDCSLPAWPQGAWHDLQQWPTLLAGLAMLPMMAALPWMADWCRAQAVAPQAMVLLHLAAMFVPALCWRQAIGRWPPRRLAAVCALGLVVGAIAVFAVPAPLNLLLLAVAHGSAWGLAWAGQLWAPDRRAAQAASPLRAAIGYALLTLAVGALVARFGAAGVSAAHAALGLAAAVSWGMGRMMRWPAPVDDSSAEKPRHLHTPPA